MFSQSEKLGKVQRFIGHSSHEELKKLEATVGQKNGWTDKNAASLEQNNHHWVGMWHKQKNIRAIGLKTV
jgi:hypothetical protein